MTTPLRVGVLFARWGLIFPIMTGELYIIPYISVVKAQLCFVEQKKQTKPKQIVNGEFLWREVKTTHFTRFVQNIVIISYILIRTKNIEIRVLVHIAQP